MLIIESKIFKRFAELKFGFSSKYGLERKSPYWFNMSFSVGDKKETEENRRAFLTELGVNPDSLAWQKQIHGDVIRIVESPGFQGESDALVTSRKGIALGVFSADCTAIFLYDKSNGVIAAVHSGWRGTEKKILPKTLNLLSEKFSSKPENSYAFIAPSISQKNYEVGGEVAMRFPEKYLIAKEDGKFLLDVAKVNYDFLIEFGMPPENIEQSPLCSFENEYLHSYRRDGAESGRALGVISIVD